MERKTIKLSQDDAIEISYVITGFIELQTFNFLMRVEDEAPSMGESLRWAAKHLLEGTWKQEATLKKFDESSAKMFIENANKYREILVSLINE